jgi:predicted XRE-type DNA-binding protein
MEQNNIEIWKPVVGFEGWYEVSDAGRVRRCSRSFAMSNGVPRTLQVRPLKPKVSRAGYLRIGLYNQAGKQVFLPVHRLVCAAFNGPAPADRPFVNHKDLNKANNTPTNLEWCTNQENMDHASAAGLWNPLLGAKKGLDKSTVESILQDLMRRELTRAEISEKYGVTRSALSDLANGRTYTFTQYKDRKSMGLAKALVNDPYLHPAKRRKLSVEDVAEIRRMYSSDDNCLSQAAIGSLFGVEQTTVGAIVRNESWVI